MHGAVMKVDADYLRYVLGGVIADENQKLLLKLEELIMSAVTPVIQGLQTKVAALKASNEALTASAVEKDAKLVDLQNQLNTALQNAVDPADIQLLNDLLASLG